MIKNKSKLRREKIIAGLMELYEWVGLISNIYPETPLDADDLGIEHVKELYEIIDLAIDEIEKIDKNKDLYGGTK